MGGGRQDSDSQRRDKIHVAMQTRRADGGEGNKNEINAHDQNHGLETRLMKGGRQRTCRQHKGHCQRDAEDQRNTERGRQPRPGQFGFLQDIIPDAKIAHSLGYVDQTGRNGIKPRLGRSQKPRQNHRCQYVDQENAVFLAEGQQQGSSDAGHAPSLWFAT
jgi:hypothetical protein